VPTWNYAVVQARGRARSVEDADWLAALVSELTTVHESGRSRPWAVTDAPERYIAAQLRGIVGIEIEIAEIAGKWKVSQNRSEADRAGAAEGLSAEARPDAAAMAALVRGDA
jgi:transcriptional regulator